MALGVVLHSANLYVPGDPAAYLTESSHVIFKYLVEAVHLFRMPAFFLISGFFCMMSLKKYGTQQFISSRAKRILIPLAATVFSLNVVELWFRSAMGASLPGAPVWTGTSSLVEMLLASNWLLHLWFLVVLFIYFVVAAGAYWAWHKLLGQRRVAVKDFGDRARVNVFLLAPLLAGLAYGPHVVGALLPGVIFTPFIAGVSLFMVLEYLPFFAVGAVLYFAPAQFLKLRAIAT